MTDVPIIALTATAPKAIKISICDSLGISRPAVIALNLDRSSIYFSTSKSKGISVST